MTAEAQVSSQPVLLDRLEGGVLTLTLNRPERLNAFNAALIEGLSSALERAAEQPVGECAKALVPLLGVPVGGALSFFFSGPLAQAYGWRAAMVLAAAPALLLVPALLLLPEPQRGASEVHPVPLSRGSMWTILRVPTLWWIIASGALLNFNLYAIAAFLPAFLSRVHGLSLASSGVASGIVYITGGLAGCLAAGSGHEELQSPE